MRGPINLVLYSENNTKGVKGNMNTGEYPDETPAVEHVYARPQPVRVLLGEPSLARVCKLTDSFTAPHREWLSTLTIAFCQV